ncbi:MAG: carboxypeptidase-like regulatory domain-containing protein [Saprospiraceae bacterium]|nr:carboxypeptidase-like regulatory domain-containing protein [Saprospiraceae bacterium]
MGRWLYSFIFVCISTLAWAQPYTIKGRVLDADTKEGLPFSNVYFAGTTIGVPTDLDGYYEITTEQPYDSLTASALGYQILSKSLTREPEQTVDFYLSSSQFDLQEIVVLAGENPANRIVKGIIANKDKNRIEAQDAFQYESYAKVELDLENIDEKLRNSKLLKPFEFVFENIDSTSDEKPFLPMYINEVLEDVYYVKGEGNPKNLIRAQRTSGTDNPTLVEYIKKIHAPFSIYDNWIYVLEKGFISPFANGGLGYYEYYIMDSTLVDGKLRYQLKFKPKRKQETTFYGDFWVEDSTFAIERVNMRMSPDVNINLVKRIIIYQEFKPSDSLWLPVTQKMIVDFAPAEKVPGMIGRRTETFRNFVINHDQTKTQYEKTSPEDNLRDPNFVDSEEFWAKARHVPLNKTEETVYAMVDSIKNVPAYKTYTQIIEIIVNGYFITGSVELGPYASVYSVNPVEGNRFRFGMRTSTNFSKDLRFGGYIAYGTKDEEFKYGGDFVWVMNKYPRKVIGGAYKNDISLNSESSEDFVESDFFSGTLRRNVPMKLIRVEEGKLYYERYWNKGFSNRITLLKREMDPYGGIPESGFNYAYLNDTEAPFDADTTISTTEFIFKRASLMTKLCWMAILSG